MPMPTHATLPHPVESVDSAAVDAALARRRAELDALDDELTGLIRRRRDVSRDIQRLRMENGGPRIQHAREREVLGRYRQGLGADGGKLALAILELCRGRA